MERMDPERIRDMESALEDCSAAVETLSAALTRMEELRGRMLALHRYYGSEAWYADREGGLPEGLRAGVLSEDLVYDEISALRAEAFRMLELGTDILKNRLG